MYLDLAHLYQPLLLSPSQGKAAYQTTFLSIWKERSFPGARVHCREFKPQHFLNILGEVKEYLLIACCMQADVLGALPPFHPIALWGRYQCCHFYRGGDGGSEAGLPQAQSALPVVCICSDWSVPVLFQLLNI